MQIHTLASECVYTLMNFLINFKVNTFVTITMTRNRTLPATQKFPLYATPLPSATCNYYPDFYSNHFLVCMFSFDIQMCILRH